MSLFNNWYTDSVDVYRSEQQIRNNVTESVRVLKSSGNKCRVHRSKITALNMRQGVARDMGTDKLSCPLSVDIQKGDELLVIRGKFVGSNNAPERYFAGNPQSFYDPIGGVLTGLEHKEIALLVDTNS